ncbi:LmeA family phospholipid-binding protein [Aliterella atlantica]|uniref:DUF2993 domain-containing protein n=1 Tax=Aliterella atlantica CENA595 TaxID=1618023 RepID=A0A0D8ZWE8_9CYAN|nr:DUF2993 domain-containing protein [Aliterella atlantica]KJH73080.1 hypothetical protein UH38_03175 [Aliterella atlantica CENA595]
MEFLTIFLSSWLGIISPAGLVVETAAAKAVRSQFARADKLQVRLDNAPTHQLLNGKVQRIRIAGRGLELKQPSLRLAVLELESDPIDINLRPQKQLQLEQPLQAGVRLVVQQQDINRALRSPQIAAKLGSLSINFLKPQSRQAPPAYNLVNPRLELLANNRLRFQVELTEANTKLAIRVETGINLIASKQIQLLEPVIYVNQEEVPQQLVRAIANNLGTQLNLANLEAYGITARILKLQISPDQIEIAAFLRVDPSVSVTSNQ